MSVSAAAIEHLLPQTQCRQCGYEGCAPYAAALAAGTAAINLCTPGGDTVIHDLAGLLQRAPLPPADAAKAAAPKVIARIVEDACIGCTACIKACPTDAILGATKYMHSVISDECTGCELCVPPCPVDCIELVPVADAWLPRAGVAAAPANPRRGAADYALERYRKRQDRLARQAAAKAARLAQKRAAAQGNAAAAVQTDSGRKLNPTELIAQAMARAQAQQTQRQSTANRNDFQQQQLQREQERAALRRAQRDVQYGNEAERAAALAWLKAHKAAENGE
ncbi:electron transport complex protein RnfB [Neisseria sp. HSC-16F19]|nr:RnfABCDGE type electron transport complex subunit B [Neisseria sp. HSC-16F19]MCP2040712.1 electron transport complex protein RnfB [Neisseria sp. HSC-16F19]